MTRNASLEDRAVVITGGGSGIGRAAARAFAREGARVLIVGRSRAKLEETARGHTTVHGLARDLTDRGADRQIVQTAVRELGGIDVLVNNAGIVKPAALGDIRREAAEEQFAINLWAPIFLTQEALPELERSSGAIINVTSVPAYRGWPGFSIYGSTKVALDFLTRTWAVELAPKGIRVASVAPGPIDTPIMDGSGLDPSVRAAHLQELLARIPLHRKGTPEEVAFWIVNLARPEASYTTGLVLYVDGGAHAA